MPDWISALERLRFDIVRRDPLQAHKEYGSRIAVDIYLADDSQLKVVAVRTTAGPRAIASEHADGKFQVFREEQTVTTVTYRIQEGDDPVPILVEMELAARAS